MTDVPQRLGVVGAGTMGAGVAQLGGLAGIETLLHDPIEDALDRGMDVIRTNLGKGAEHGRWTSDDAAAAAGRARPVRAVAGLAGCALVSEAAPDRVDQKPVLYGSLSEI